MKELKSIVRYGTVSAVYPDRATVRVVFSDRENMVSAELAVLMPACYQSRFYSLPRVGDNVVALMFPNGDDGAGCVLGSFYSEKNKPPAASEDIVMMNIADKLVISFDQRTQELKIDCKGDIKIQGKRVYIN